MSLPLLPPLVGALPKCPRGPVGSRSCRGSGNGREPMDSAGNNWEYWYGCEDLAGRPSKGVVIWRDGAVRIMAPPPGTAVFGPADIDQLAHLLMSVTMGIDALRRGESGDEQRGRSS